MRAHWLSPLEIKDEYILTGDSLHHLVNVIRIEKGESLLLLNGEGLCVETIVEQISKKELKLRRISDYFKNQDYEFHLALGMPKRDALELSLKQATELGFKKVFLIKSDFSQMRFPEQDRLHNLLVSALEQSNASYLPEVVQAAWSDIAWNEYDEALLLDSQTKTATPEHIKTRGKKILIVGPEGGFSPEELNYLHAVKEVKVLTLPTPILRTPTAVAAGAGILIESLLK
jgi:16S rRNA (uracil1498-N3)-methyltransferase